MTFKINKSSVKINIQPAGLEGSNPRKAHADLINIIDDLANTGDMSSNTVAALSNRHVSKAFEDLYVRGINPLRAEILFMNEIIPIGTGENEDENSNITSINLNYGEGTNLKVNQVMRLIDLQRIIRKSILKKSGDFLEEYIDISNSDQEKIIKHMHKVLKRNNKNFLELGSDTEAMVSLLIEISANTDSYGLVGTGGDATASSIIKSISESDKVQYLRSITRYTLLDYIAQNSITFITRIYNLKDLLKEAISIAQTELPPPESHSPIYMRTMNNSDPLGNAASVQDNPEKMVGVNIQFGANDSVSMANKLLRRWGMPTNVGPDGFSPGSRHSLTSVINADIDSEKTEELFGSNKHMYANLFANLLKSMTFMQTLSGEGKKHVNKAKISFTSGKKNLAKGLAVLKSITPRSMSSEHFVLNGGLAGSLDGSKIDAMLSAVSDDKDTSIVELVSAVCYDQSAGSNILGGFSKIKAPQSFSTFEGFSSFDNLIVEYFNKVFFNTNKSTWSDLALDSINSFDYSSIAKNENMMGAYLRSRFSPVNDEGILYVPNEHTYEDNIYSDNSFVNSPDYFFNKAVESEELNFDIMVAESKKVLSDIDTIVHDISLMMGLDFDADGNPDVTNVNGFADDQNPLSYFYSMCKVLGKEARRTSSDLDESADLAVPLIHAGKLDDLSFTADVIKGSFFSALANKTNQHLILNLNEDSDGNPVDKNILNSITAEYAKEESMCMFAAEKLYYAEDRIWYRLFTGPLAGILDDGAASVNSSKEKYGADKSKDYNSLLSNGLQSGLGDFNSAKNDDGAATYASYRFGDNGWNDNEHDDYYEERKSGDTEVFLGKKLNIKTGLNGWQIVLAIAIGVIVLPLLATVGVAAAASFGTTFLGAGAIGTTTSIIGGVTVTGPLVTSTFLGALMATVFSTLGVASLATGAAVSLGTWVAIESNETPDEGSRPSGVGFSKSGLFETVLLTNAALVPPSLRPKTEAQATSEERLTKIMSMLFGSLGKENFMLKSKLQTGDVRAPLSLESLIDSIAEFFQNAADWFKGWFSDDEAEANEGTISEEDYHKPYHFSWNNNAGEYGGIFKTNTASRYTIFTLFFSRVMYKSLSVGYGGQSGEFIIKHYPTCWIGMADALELKSKNSDYDTNGKYANLKSIYDTAYNRTTSLMGSVRASMLYRRASILRNLRYLKQNSDEIREAVRRAEKVFAGNSADIPPGEKIALKYLQKVGFAKTGFSFLNDNTSGTLLRNYQKKYLLDFRSDIDESANPEGISVYPYFKLESYDIRELKIMAKLFSKKGRGLTSSIDDSLGRKTMMHIGIPVG